MQTNPGDLLEHHAELVPDPLHHLVDDLLLALREMHPRVHRAHRIGEASLGKVEEVILTEGIIQTYKQRHEPTSSDVPSPSTPAVFLAHFSHLINIISILIITTVYHHHHPLPPK